MFTKTHAKYIQSLHDKKHRDAEGVFFAEGPKVVAELLQGNKFACTLLAATAAWLQQNQDWLRGLAIGQVLEVKDFELEKISALSQPNQVLAVLVQRKPSTDFNTSGQLTILLDGLQDPGNLGTILRTADWFGVSNIVCTPNCADVYNPKVVQSTMGSLGRVNVVYTDALAWLDRQKAPLYAAALDGTALGQVGRVKEGILVIGNESKGVSPAILQRAQHTITIPRSPRGQAESLNAAVALGIVLAQWVVDS
jgi:RNA methyltransferase, TrmH family